MNRLLRPVGDWINRFHCIHMTDTHNDNHVVCDMDDDDDDDE